MAKKKRGLVVLPFLSAGSLHLAGGYATAVCAGWVGALPTWGCVVQRSWVDGRWAWLLVGWWWLGWMGTVMIRSAANRRVAVAILRVVFCIYLPQYPTKNITVLYKRLFTKKRNPTMHPIPLVLGWRLEKKTNPTYIYTQESAFNIEACRACEEILTPHRKQALETLQQQNRVCLANSLVEN